MIEARSEDDVRNALIQEMLVRTHPPSPTAFCNPNEAGQAEPTPRLDCRSTSTRGQDIRLMADDTKARQ